MSTNGATSDYASPDEWRTEPMYSFAEAGKLAGVSTGTVRNWLLGYSQKEWANSEMGRVRQERTEWPLSSTRCAPLQRWCHSLSWWKS